MEGFFCFEGDFGMQKMQGMDEKVAFFVKGFTINSECDERFVKNVGIGCLYLILNQFKL